jgi:hypothetical protein
MIFCRRREDYADPFCAVTVENALPSFSKKYLELSVREGRETLFDFFRAWPEFEVPECDPYDLSRTVGTVIERAHP